MSLITLTLPWPPTANTYWRRQGNKYFISPKGIAYRNEVFYVTKQHHNPEFYSKPISLFICAFPPDKRRRDLDNLLKATCDALQYANMFKDDNQIDVIYIKRMKELSGCLIVKIDEAT